MTRPIAHAVLVRASSPTALTLLLAGRRAGARAAAVSVACAFLLGVVASAWPTTVSAEEEMIRIASGRKGFTYRSVYARNLEKLMRGYKFIYLPSEGSGQNLDLLADGKANVAFAQADVYAERLDTQPERFAGLLVVGRLAPECVYVAHAKASPVESIADLAAKANAGGAKIAVGSPDSGMAGTWSFLRRRMPGLEKVRVDHTEGTLALNQLGVGGLDAVGWVSDPGNPDQKMLRALLANDGLALMPLALPELAKPAPGGFQVYALDTVDVGDAKKSLKVDTLCTSAILFTRKDAGERLIDKLADTLSLQRDKILASPGK